MQAVEGARQGVLLGAVPPRRLQVFWPSRVKGLIAAGALAMSAAECVPSGPVWAVACQVSELIAIETRPDGPLTISTVPIGSREGSRSRRDQAGAHGRCLPRRRARYVLGGDAHGIVEGCRSAAKEQIHKRRIGELTDEVFYNVAGPHFRVRSLTQLSNSDGKVANSLLRALATQEELLLSVPTR